MRDPWSLPARILWELRREIKEYNKVQSRYYRLLDVYDSYCEGRLARRLDSECRLLDEEITRARERLTALEEAIAEKAARYLEERLQALAERARARIREEVAGA